MIIISRNQRGKETQPKAKTKKLHPETLLLGSQKIPLGENVYARVVRERNTKRLEIAVIINDETTAEQLRNSWGNIDFLREKIKLAQGSDLTGLIQALRIVKAHNLETGMSYAEVALETNHDVLVNFCAAFLDMQMENFVSANERLYYAQSHLIALRMKTEEVADWTWVSLKEIQKGRAPWTLTSGPVNKERVRASYRQTYREFKSSKIVIGERSLPEVQNIRSSDLSSLPENKGLKLANNLLAKEPDEGGLPKLNKAIARHLELQRVENTG